MRYRASLTTAAAALLALAPAARARAPRQHPQVPHGLELRQVIVPNARSAAFAARSVVQVTGVEARVRITGRVARTTLEIALANPGRRQAEAELLLPVPAGAAISGFLFEGTATGPTAELLRADDARRTYDEIVARLRDPALLEFAGYAAVRSSVFPVPAGGTQRVQLSYEETLTADGPRIDYVLPRTATLDAATPWSLELAASGPAPIAAIYSPTHALREVGRSPHGVTVALDGAAGSEPGAFRCSILTGGDGLPASILACPDPDGTGGTFLLFAAPPTGAGRGPVLDREVTVVLDRSGSMAGEKFEQARTAALQVLEGLRPGERFRIVDYSDQVNASAAAAVVKTPQTIRAAREYLAALTTGGGTNIAGALAEALAPAPEARGLGLVLFLTDGLPTVGERSEHRLREGAQAANAHGRRLFTFGVGDDVNAPLLDALAETTRATSSYVRPGEDVEVAVGTLFKRLAGPRLADLSLRVLDADGSPDRTLVRDLLPSSLPDLFEGDQLVLLGRYTQARPLVIELTGRGARGEEKFVLRGDLGRAHPRNDYVPRLWAARRISELTDLIRQTVGEGLTPAALLADARTKELADEVLRLSLRYGVLSEFTAFLALEGTELDGWSQLTAQASENIVNGTQAARSGAAAVNTARNVGELKQSLQQNLSNGYWNAADERVEVGRAQVVAQGVLLQRGGSWIEGRLLEGREEAGLPAANEDVELGSAAHRRLVSELAADGRADLAGVRGELLIQHRGRVVRLRNGGTADPGEEPQR